MNSEDKQRLTESPAGQSALVEGYMSGFDKGFETEVLAGTLPIGRNSPQRCA